MNESETSFATGGTSEIENLRNEVKSLRTSFSVALVFLFIFSFFMNVFMYRQMAEMSALANRNEYMVTSWGPNGAAQAQAMDFWNRLNEFAKTHPDFAPIINKYSQYITPPRPAAATPAPKK